MSVRSLANITVLVQSRAVTSDTLGSGGTDTFSTKFANYRCRIQPLSGDETIEFDKETVRITHRMYSDFREGTLVENDRIVFNSENYDVRLVRNMDNMDRHFQIDLEQVK